MNKHVIVDVDVYAVKLIFQDNNVTITNAEICFCSTDRCNNADHMPPAPTTPAPGNSAAAVLGCLATTLAALLLAY